MSPAHAAYPSRLAEDGEHLRMTVVIVAVTARRRM
jgi:hypothetical protein